MTDETRTPILPAHIDDTVQAIARLHAEHQSEATTSQRLVERLTAGAGRPRSLIALTTIMIGWMAVNLALSAMGHKAWDEPPFSWLQGATGVAALYMTILILVTRRRED